MSKSRHIHQLATEMYVRLGKTQKEIAETLDYSEQTVSKWKVKFNWETKRAAQVSGPDEIAKILLAQVAKVCALADEEERQLTSTEADQISKLSSSIAKIRKDISPGIMVEVMETFVVWLKGVDRVLAQKIVVHQMKFLEEKIKEVS